MRLRLSGYPLWCPLLPHLRGTWPNSPRPAGGGGSRVMVEGTGGAAVYLCLGAALTWNPGLWAPQELFLVNPIANKSYNIETCGNKEHQNFQNMILSQGLELKLNMLWRTTWNFCIRVYEFFTCCLASFLTSYQYFVTTKRKVTNEWKICFSNIFAPLNFWGSLHSQERPKAVAFPEVFETLMLLFYKTFLILILCFNFLCLMNSMKIIIPLHFISWKKTPYNAVTP